MLILVTPIWARAIAPMWDRGIAAIGVGVVHALERESRVAGVRVEGEWTVVTRTPAGAPLGEQRLELRTHHNNVPFLIALMLGASVGPWPSRLGRLLAALGILALTHVATFVLAIHWEYAFRNVGTYHLDDRLAYLVHAPWWQQLTAWAQLKKTIVLWVFELQMGIGRLVWPVVLWMWLAPVRRRESNGPVGPQPVPAA